MIMIFQTFFQYMKQEGYDEQIYNYFFENVAGLGEDGHLDQSEAYDML